MKGIDGLSSAAWLSTAYDADVWLISDYRNKPIKIFFDWLLPDGTKLTDEANRHICDIVKSVVYGIRTGPLATTGGSDHQAQTAAELRNLVCWMKLQTIQNFSDLDEDDFREYFSQRVRDLAECLQLVPRVQEVMRWYSECPTQMPTFGDLLAKAGIDPRTTNLIKVSDAVDQFYRDSGVPNPRKVPRKGTGLRTGEDLAIATRRALLGKLRYLWTFNTRLNGEGFSFDPFEVGNAIAKKSDGAEGRTATIPQQQGMYLLDRACRWVLRFGSELLALQTKLDERMSQFGRYDMADNHADVQKLLSVEGRKALPSGLALSNVSARGTTRITLNKAVNGFLPVACLIVISIFTARRHSEVLSIREEAIKGSLENGYWLQTNIAKTYQREDITPCPPIVVAAVELLKV